MPFRQAELDTLGAVLDLIVPPSQDGRLPGAGEIGLAVEVAAACDSSAEARAPVADGLAALEAAARKQGAASFRAAPPAQRLQTLRDHAAQAPFFLPGLVFHTYRAYYQHPRVLAGLGLGGRPPFPQGYAVAPTDFDALLARVRRMTPFYREP